MYKQLVSCVFVLACLLGASSLQAQSVFYSNTVDDNNFFPAGVEIAMPVAFTGSYEVDSFKFGYFLPLDSPNGATTDAIINFYTSALPAGDAYSGYDSVQQYYPNLVSSTRLTDLAADASGVTNIVTDDLTTFGDFFQWDAAPLATGETGGWVSIQFTNPDAGWEIARGDSQDNVFQDMSNGNLEDFGGTPQAAFDLQLSGQNLTPAAVPESSTLLLFACGLGGLAVTAVRSRLRSRRVLGKASSTIS